MIWCHRLGGRRVLSERLPVHGDVGDDDLPITATGSGLPRRSLLERPSGSCGDHWGAVGRTLSVRARTQHVDMTTALEESGRGGACRDNDCTAAGLFDCLDYGTDARRGLHLVRRLYTAGFHWHRKAAERRMRSRRLRRLHGSVYLFLRRGPRRSWFSSSPGPVQRPDDEGGYCTRAGTP